MCVCMCMVCEVGYNFAFHLSCLVWWAGRGVDVSSSLLSFLHFPLLLFLLSNHVILPFLGCFLMFYSICFSVMLLIPFARHRIPSQFSTTLNPSPLPLIIFLGHCSSCGEGLPDCHRRSEASSGVRILRPRVPTLQGDRDCGTRQVRVTFDLIIHQIVFFLTSAVSTCRLG